MDNDDINLLVNGLMGWELAQRQRIRRGRLQEWSVPRCRHPHYSSGRWSGMSHFPHPASSLGDANRAVLALLTEDVQQAKFAWHLTALAVGWKLHTPSLDELRSPLHAGFNLGWRDLFATQTASPLRRMQALLLTLDLWPK